MYFARNWRTSSHIEIQVRKQLGAFQSWKIVDHHGIGDFHCEG